MIGVVDIVILAIFGVFFLLGFWKGFTKQIWSLIVLAASIAAAVFLSAPVGGMLAGTGLKDTVDGWVSSLGDKIPFGLMDTLAGDADIATGVLTVFAGIGIFFVVLIGLTVIKTVVVHAFNKNREKKSGMSIINRILGGLFKSIYAFLFVAVVAFLFGRIQGILPESVGSLVTAENNIITNWFCEGQWLDKIWAFIISLA